MLGKYARNPYDENHGFSLKTGKTIPTEILLVGSPSKTAWVDGYPSMINLIASELSLFFGPLTPARPTATPFAPQGAYSKQRFRVGM
jgi:hypothetical protein